jgi:hypothetical protein
LDKNNERPDWMTDLKHTDPLHGKMSSSGKDVPNIVFMTLITEHKKDHLARDRHKDKRGVKPVNGILLFLININY